MADRTIIEPQYANSLNGIFNGTATITVADINATNIATDNISATGSVGLVATGSDSYALYNDGDALVVKGIDTITPTIQLTNGSNSASLSCIGNGILDTTALELSNTSGAVRIAPITTNYLGLINTTTGANTASIQGGSFNALTSVITPVINLIASGGANTNITLLNNNVNLTSNLTCPVYTGGLYCDSYNVSPPHNLAVSTSFNVQFNITWNPTPSWTSDTICVIPFYISDYPLNTTGIGLTKTSSTELQIVITVFNSYGAPSNLYGVNYLVLNQA